MKTQDYYLTKANTTKRVLFPATEDTDGFLISPQGHPMVVGEDIQAAGFKPADFQQPMKKLTDAQRELVLRVGDNRGHLVESREVEKAAKIETEKAERDKQNAFLRQHGYNWKKQSVYIGGELGENVYGWFLFAPNGTAVVGIKDGGWGRPEEFGSVEALLIELGYYGEEKKREVAENRAKAEADAKAKAEARERVDVYFKGTESEFAVCERKERERIYLSRTNRSHYVIDESGLYTLVYNGMDGDDWALNNDSMYISHRYPRNAQIERDLRLLNTNK